MSDSRKRSTHASSASSAPAQLPQTEPLAAANEGLAMGGCLLRLAWMGPGNLVLLYFAGSIARMPSWSLSWLDAAFWSTVAALAAARLIDVARFHGQTIHAEPATRWHARRYTAILAALALALWLGVHSIEA